MWNEKPLKNVKERAESRSKKNYNPAAFCGSKTTFTERKTR